MPPLWFQKLDAFSRITVAIFLDGIPSTVIHEKALLVADAVEPAGRPRYPYLYELPGDERFDY